MLTAAAFAVVAGLAATLSGNDALSALQLRAEVCIRDNASQVERNDPSLAQATTFLVDDLCAVEIGHYTNYQRSTQQLATLRASYGLQDMLADNESTGALSAS